MGEAGDDLSVVSDGRQEYASGWIVSDISFRAGAEAVEFTNGSEVTISEATSSFDEDVRKAQVFETVRQHLDKERTLAPLGVKVLSLFFIDKVANYRGTDEHGNPVLGKIGQWFEEAYNDLASRPRYAPLRLPPVSQVHDGYFSVDNKGIYRDTRGTTEADSSTYDLIMRAKGPSARLLAAGHRASPGPSTAIRYRPAACPFRNVDAHRGALSRPRLDEGRGAKIIDANWWTGAPAAIGWYEPFLVGVIARHAVLVAVIVVALQWATHGEIRSWLLL